MPHSRTSPCAAACAAIALLIGATGVAAAAHVRIPTQRVVDVRASSGVGDDGELGVDHIADNRDWSVWRSERADADGAWIIVGFDRVEYVSRIEIVAGDARGRDAFVSCGRPARLRVETGAQRHDVDIEDKRWRQRIDIEPPMSGRTYRLTVEKRHGSPRASICVSEIRFFGPDDVVKAIPGLERRIIGRLEPLMSPRETDAARDAAADEIASIGAPAVPALLARLGADYGAARVAQILGRIGDERAIVPLARATRSVDDEVRAAARVALAAFGPRARAEIEPLMRSESNDDVAAALGALGVIDHPDADAYLNDGLVSADVYVRAASIEALGRRRAVAARAAVLESAMSRFTEERAASAFALGRFAYADDLPLIESLTWDNSLSVRSAAAQALIEMGDTARPAAVTLALEGPDAATADTAAGALMTAGIGNEIVVQMLSARHAAVRERASRELAQRGASGRLALARAIISPDSTVRAAAGVALESMGPGVVLDLLAVANSPAPEALPDLLSLLAKLGDPAGAEYAVQYVTRGPNRQTREAAVQAVAQCASHGMDLSGPIVAALHDKAWEVQHAALVAVAHRHVPGTVPHVVALLDGLQDRNDLEMMRLAVPKLRQAAVEALGAVPHPDAVRALGREYMRTRHEPRDAMARRQIVSAVGRLGGSDSIAILIEALSDRDDKVRDLAEVALR